MRLTFEPASKAVLLAILAAVVSLPLTAEPPSRIKGTVDDAQTFVLAGNTSPRIRNASDVGAVDPALKLDRVTMHLGMSDLQQKELDQLVVDQQNQSSPQFHKWLTPEQYGNRFGASPMDVAKIQAWMTAKGFQNIQIARSRTSVSGSATAGQAEAAFRTFIHRYESEGKMHYANSSDPVLPFALQGVVRHISGLNDFHPRPRVHAVRKTASKPHWTSSITGDTFFAPGDFATIYNVTPLYNEGVNGDGVKIAIAGQTDITLSQVAAFRSAAGLSANTPQVILDGVDPGVSESDQVESYLDVEWAGAIARRATVIFVNSTDVTESESYVVNNNLADVFPITYGLCEAEVTDISTENALFEQASSQGMTVIAASGDDGAADCDGGSTGPPPPVSTTVTTATHGLAVDFPASSPYVTAVGGTMFNEGSGSYWSSTNGSGGGSATGYIPEVVWNETSASVGLSASGGGISTVFTKPSWQTGTGVPNDGMRDVPDVALNAAFEHDEYLICADDGTVQNENGEKIEDCTNGFRDANTDLDVVGGTSAASPSFGGVMALLNQALAARQGTVNPRLYALAASTSSAFHDITSGNNEVPCSAGSTDCPSSGELGYTATVGYDQTTGLGSVDANVLVSNWAAGFLLQSATSSLNLAASSSGTATVNVVSLDSFTGTVSLTCTVSGALTDTTCSIPSSVAAANSFTVTLNNSNTSKIVGWFRRPGSGTLGLIACALGLLLVWMAYRSRSTGRLLAAGLAMGGLILMTSCGGGSSSSSGSGSTTTVSTPVTGTVVVTGTANSVSHSVSFSVTQN